MTWTIDHILQSIANRDSADRWGIGTAKQYLGGIESCLTGGGICPTKVFGVASADAWTKELSESSGRLTYCDQSTADPDFIQKSIRDGSGIAPGAILEYDAVLSSTRKDRDGDILESGGLEIDTKMADLWQHIQVSPIGKHVSVLQQTDNLVLCRFAIADTELGRDAAVLTRFGALRKSHGFKPTEFEPVEIVKSADGKNVVKGWHVKRAVVLEASLVSIPSNADGNVIRTYEKEFDGICTAFSRGKLHDELVKSWAKNYFDRRPTQSPGFDLSTKAAVDATKKHLLDAASRELADQFSTPVKAAKTDGKAGKCKCGEGEYDKDGKCPKCDGESGESASAKSDKSAGDLVTKDLWAAMESPYLPASYEAIQYQLDRTAGNYLTSKGVISLSDDGYASTVGTFADHAIVCYRKYGKPQSKTCYRIAWKLNESGQAVWDGDPSEVAIDISIVAKMSEHLQTKSAGMAESNSAEQVTENTGGGESLETLARQLAAKSFAADGDDGVRALEIAADAAVVLKRQREFDELQSLIN